jgi:hypothetical protein
MKKTHRSLDKGKDWMFFQDSLPIPIESLAQIKVLTEEYSEELWRKYVEPKASDRHNKEFLIQLFQNSPAKTEWMKKWNQGQGEELASFLFFQITWPTDEIILFFWSKQKGIETTWNIFLRHWMNFLFDDEWPILLNPARSERIVFSPSGELGITK